MNEREDLSCGEAGDLDATAQNLLIAGERGRNVGAIKQAFKLWNLIHLPLRHIRAIAHGIVEDDKQENPQFYK